MLAPGYQAELFDPPATGTPRRWRVVDTAGRRSPATPTLALAVGQARALALAAGSAWLVADDRDAVEIAWTGQRFTVTPCGPGWPATSQQILAAHGIERNRT